MSLGVKRKVALVAGWAVTLSLSVLFVMAFARAHSADLGASSAMLVGLVLGLAWLASAAIVVSQHISNRAGPIAETLELAMEEPPIPNRVMTSNEMARALKAAGRVRHAIAQARRDTSRMEESFSALAQALHVGVVLVNDKGEPSFANPRALDLLARPTVAQLKAEWDALASTFREAIVRVGASENGPAIDVEVPTTPARTLRVEPFRLGGDDCEDYLILLNDPGILDTLETDIRLANQLQGVARLYRTVAHELRAPLSAMMIHLDLLRESLNNEEDESHGDRDRYVVVLRDELERLNRSLSEALTQTVPDVAKRHKFDLRDAVQEIGALLAPQARRQGVSLETSFPDEPVLLLGQRDRLKQSFLNIAVNSLEAMPKGGVLKVTMKVGGSRAEISFIDSGRGIPRNVLEKIYDRDFTTKGSGSGIGLYVARTLVEMHGGVIHVESEVSRGTRVDVFLPVLVRD